MITTTTTFAPLAAALERWADAKGLDVNSPEGVAHITAQATRLAGLLDLVSEPLPSPAPALVELPPLVDRFPEPEGFQEEIIIGYISSEPVYGIQEWCSIAGRAEHQSVRVHLNGLTLDLDSIGELCLMGEDANFCAALPLAAAVRLGEVAQLGALEQLAVFAREWCAEPAEPAVAHRKAA